jgi:hypothetical protein
MQSGRESEHLAGAAKLELDGELAGRLVAGEVVLVALELQDTPPPAGEAATASMGLSPVGGCPSGGLPAPPVPERHPGGPGLASWAAGWYTRRRSPTCSLPGTPHARCLHCSPPTR